MSRGGEKSGVGASRGLSGAADGSLPSSSVFLRVLPSAGILVQSLSGEQRRQAPLMLLLSCAQWYARGLLECETAMAALDAAGSSGSMADKSWRDLQRGPL